MATSETEICNSALNKIGAKTILNLDEESKAGRLCKKQYPLIRDEVLASHLWNFAIKRQELSKLASAPAFEYTVAHSLPADCLRVLKTDLNLSPAGQTERKWKIENLDDAKVLVSDNDEVFIMYIAKITDVSLYSASFVEALAWRLAADFAYPLTNSNTLAQNMFAIFEDRISKARSFDGQEGSLDIVDASEWTTVRI